MSVLVKGKNTAHNLIEVKVLIRESYARGDDDRFDGILWTKHDSNEPICLSVTRFTEFELIMPDRSSITCEVELL